MQTEQPTFSLDAARAPLWFGADAGWGDAVRAARADQKQPFGGKATLARLELAVADPAATARRYHQGVGLAVLTREDGSAELPIGAQLLRVVPSGRAVPGCSIVIAGTAGGPRSVDLLGCRFEVEVALAE